jgi:lipopolysaccharide/colanic/teichoic acid biosynthesis glycosyltransferase
MSFIGPRPVVASHFALYSEDQQNAIRRMRPGLSGIGSLFFRDEESILSNPDHEAKWVHDHVAAPYKGSLEKWYADQHTVFNYFKLIFLTVLAVLNPKFRPLKWFSRLPPPPDLLRHHWE